MASLRSPRLQAAIWALVVGIGMLLPGNALLPIGSWLPASLEGWIDKIEHFVAFFVMTILVFRVLSASGETGHGRLTAAGLTCSYAVLLEVLQIPHPSRYWAPVDLVADGLGIVLSVLFMGGPREP